MPTLAEQLAAQREKGAAATPPEVRAVMAAATAEVRDGWDASGMPSVGDTAPGFARPGLDGKTVHLRNLVRSGPVVASFFRGRW